MSQELDCSELFAFRFFADLSECCQFAYHQSMDARFLQAFYPEEGSGQLMWMLIKAEERLMLSRAAHFPRPILLDERQAFSLCAYDWNLIRWMTGKHLLEHMNRMKYGERVIWRARFVNESTLYCKNSFEMDVDAFHLNLKVRRYSIPAAHRGRIVLPGSEAPAVIALVSLPPEEDPKPKRDTRCRRFFKGLRRMLRCILTCGCATNRRTH